jgi:hypothetical protein
MESFLKVSFFCKFYDFGEIGRSLMVSWVDSASLDVCVQILFHSDHAMQVNRLQKERAVKTGKPAQLFDEDLIMKFVK